MLYYIRWIEPITLSYPSLIVPLVQASLGLSRRYPRYGTLLGLAVCHRSCKGLGVAFGRIFEWRYRIPWNLHAQIQQTWNTSSYTIWYIYKFDACLIGFEIYYYYEMSCWPYCNTTKSSHSFTIVYSCVLVFSSCSFYFFSARSHSIDVFLLPMDLLPGIRVLSCVLSARSAIRSRCLPGLISVVLCRYCRWIRHVQTNFIWTSIFSAYFFFYFSCFLFFFFYSIYMLDEKACSFIVFFFSCITWRNIHILFTTGMYNILL